MSSIPVENDRKNKKSSPHQRRDDEHHGARAWGILLFAIFGASATTLAIYQLRRTGAWLFNQLTKPQSNPSWKNGGSNPRWGPFREEAWKRYNRGKQEEYEEEMQRVERIRRMQEIFNRERNKYRRSYERWREYGPEAYQQYQKDDWYWQYSNTSHRDESADYRSSSTYAQNNSLSHHYSVLGLDRSRKEPYSDAEIKTNYVQNFVISLIIQAAFRVVAMKYHPDLNPNNTQAAEAKFKEVMASYEAIKSERKSSCS